MTDRGPGFTCDPGRSATLPPAESESGRGLFLVRRMTDRVHIGTGPAGVTVTMTMNLHARAA